MNLLNHKLYIEDIKYIASLPFPWQAMANSSILVSGASGLVGSFMVDVFMYKNQQEGLNCTIYALGRNAKSAASRFSQYWGSKYFTFISHDINEQLSLPNTVPFKFVMHLASNTHPVAYASDPIGTITTNIIGTKNMLDFAAAHHAEKFLFASSNEIYGENRGDTEFFDELYSGYIDCNTMRAGYPESKRCGEALCQAYKSQKNLNVVIPRLTRSYGPTMLMTDTKAISQFIRKGIAGENIILKSAGTQYYSYTYVADAVAGLLAVLLNGENGAAYNIADTKSDIMLKDLAQTIADICGTKVVFELPDDLEKSGYSTATKARLDGSKAKSIGWTAKYDILSGLRRTVQILK